MAFKPWETIEKVGGQELSTFTEKPKAFLVSESGGVFSSADEWGEERGCAPIKLRDCSNTGHLVS